MARTFNRPFPSVEKQMLALGERLKVARLRRGISTVLFAQRMNVSRDTLNRLEKGDPNISLGTYMRALRVLGLDKDMDAVALDDELGRKLQDLKLVRHKPRAPSGKATSKPAPDLPPGQQHPATDKLPASREQPKKQPKKQPKSQPSKRLLNERKKTNGPA